MTDIIQFGDLANLRKQIEEKDREIAALKAELLESNRSVLTLRGVNDLLKFQIKDLESLIATWKKSLDHVESSIRNLYQNLPSDV